MDFAGVSFASNTDGMITCDSTATMVTDLAASQSNPAAGLRCTVAHTLGNRLVRQTAPAVTAVTSVKKMHESYHQAVSGKALNSPQ